MATSHPARALQLFAAMPTSPTVLLVDDDPFSAEIAAMLLRGLGCEVALVDCGQAALDWLESAAADLILVDVRMPGMDGFETARRIRAGEAGRTPLLALTASDTERPAALAAGMDDLLAKPVDESSLSAALETWLQGRSD